MRVLRLGAASASWSACTSSRARPTAWTRYFLSADQPGCEGIRLFCSFEIFRRQPAFAVGAVGERHPFVADEDVGVMVGSLGIESEARDERDRVRKRAEHELPRNRLVAQRPAVELGDPPAYLGRIQCCHPVSIPRNRDTHT